MLVTRYGTKFVLGLVMALVAVMAIACGDDETATPAGTATASETATAGETGTATGDVRSQFPEDVQPLIADLPDNVVQMLWDLRQQGPDTMVLADGGGEYYEGLRRAFMADFEKITGWTIQNAPQTSGGWPPDFETRVSNNDSPWDIVLGGPDEIGRAVEDGLVQKLDFSDFPDLPAQHISEYYIETNQGDTPLLYNTDVFPDPATAPQSVTDIFDTEKFPGKRCMFQFPPATGLGNYEYALMADGASVDEIFDLMATKEGRDRAYAKLDTIKNDIVWVDSGASSVQFVLDGQCDLGITWNGRPALRLKDEPDLPLRMVHEGAGVWQNLYIIPVGAKHPEAAKALMVYWMQPGPQCEQLNELAYGLTALADPACLSQFATDMGPLPEPAFTWAGKGGQVLREIGSVALDEWEAWRTR